MPSSIAPLEELPQEIAAQHGLGLARDEPMRVLHSIHQRLLEDSLQAQQALLDQYQQELESLSTRWSSDARDKAERSLNAALSASKQAMAQAMQEGCSRTAAAIRAEMDAAQERIEARLQNSYRVALPNLLAACLSLAAAGVALWTMWR